MEDIGCPLSKIQILEDIGCSLWKTRHPQWLHFLFLSNFMINYDVFGLIGKDFWYLKTFLPHIDVWEGSLRAINCNFRFFSLGRHWLPLFHLLAMSLSIMAIFVSLDMIYDNLKHLKNITNVYWMPEICDMSTWNQLNCIFHSCESSQERGYLNCIRHP